MNSVKNSLEVIKEVFANPNFESEKASIKTSFLNYFQTELNNLIDLAGAMGIALSAKPAEYGQVTSTTHLPLQLPTDRKIHMSGISGFHHTPEIEGACRKIRHAIVLERICVEAERKNVVVNVSPDTTNPRLLNVDMVPESEAWLHIPEAKLDLQEAFDFATKAATPDAIRVLNGLRTMFIFASAIAAVKTMVSVDNLSLKKEIS